MLVPINTAPLAQDPHIVLACIRACIWARIEGWPFCVMKK
jgi:hypothetical protein